MKKLFMLLLVCALCLGSTAIAAEWREGLSPAQPYSGVPELNLKETFGYCFFYPSQVNAKMNVSYFCDVLEIYMPNPDVRIGEGTVTLWDADNQQVCTMDVSDPEEAQLRDLEEEELEWLMWGTGDCLELYLPISLEIGKGYYVTIDEGIMVNGNNIKCPQIPVVEGKPLENQHWVPVLNGDFGISNLYYSAAPAEESDEGEEAAEEAAPAPKYHPVTGDIVHFDILVGGDAVAAVLYSENNSVLFDTIEFETSGHVTGVITDDDVRWGVVFVDADNNPVIIDETTETRAVFAMNPDSRGAVEAAENE